MALRECSTMERDSGFAAPAVEIKEATSYHWSKASLAKYMV